MIKVLLWLRLRLDVFREEIEGAASVILRWNGAYGETTSRNERCHVALKVRSPSGNPGYPAG